MNIFRILALFLGLAFLTSHAQADALSAGDTATLQTRIDSFNTAFQTSDFDEVMTAMPPRMLSFIAKSAGMDEAVLLESMITQTSAAMESVTINDFAMALNDATIGTTDQGDTYAIIPTSTKMTVANVGKVESTTSTLALKDEGKWYLIRIDGEQQVQLLRAVYPGFSDIDFPIGTMQVVE